jgi:hypothetical protein
MNRLHLENLTKALEIFPGHDAFLGKPAGLFMRSVLSCSGVTG